jgi:Arc/MetJ-type ribon-helix-helix transcriptional regulator
MNALPADITDRIRAQLATGDFTSEEQVLREALDTLERRQQSLAKLREIVAEAEADFAAGRVAPFDREALKREVRAELAARSIVD